MDMRWAGMNGYWLAMLWGGVARSGSQRFRGAEPAGVVALELPDLVGRPDGERSTLTESSANHSTLRRMSHYASRRDYKEAAYYKMMKW
jgi:hypothetical protein